MEWTRKPHYVRLLALGPCGTIIRREVGLRRGSRQELKAGGHRREPTAARVGGSARGPCRHGRRTLGRDATATPNRLQRTTIEPPHPCRRSRARPAAAMLSNTCTGARRSDSLGADSPRGIHRGHPAHARVPQVLLQNGRFVASGWEARSSAYCSYCVKKAAADGSERYSMDIARALEPSRR